MNTDIYLDPPASQLTETAREAAHRASEAAKEVSERTTLSAKEVTDATKDVARRAADTAKELYQSAAVKAEETLAISKEYVRRNPLPVLLGAVAVGAALGYMMMMSRRKPTFGERYADEPMVAVREAILGALAPSPSVSITDTIRRWMAPEKRWIAFTASARGVPPIRFRIASDASERTSNSGNP